MVKNNCGEMTRKVLHDEQREDKVYNCSEGHYRYFLMDIKKGQFENLNFVQDSIKIF